MCVPRALYSRQAGGQTDHTLMGCNPGCLRPPPTSRLPVGRSRSN